MTETETRTLPRFSLVMPSWNTAEFLRDTIESILGQDYPDLELIIVDGGSTDGTLEILESYGTRIRWISEPDNGQCDAINKGFAMATGDLHYWANADDPLLPGTLRRVAGILTDMDRPQWMVSAARLIDGKGREIGIRRVPRVNDNTFLLWGLKWIPTQTVFWNRKMWEAAGPFDEHLHYIMDLGLWRRMYYTTPCIISDEVLAEYRLHNDAKSLKGIEKSRAERKEELTRLIAADIGQAQAKGEEAVMALATRYGHVLDELADQAALVERLNTHWFTGPVVRFYRKRTTWYPDFDV